MGHEPSIKSMLCYVMLCYFNSDIDECGLTSLPCNEQGICQDGVNIYTCQCQDGFEGHTCEISKLNTPFVHTYLHM